MIDQETMFDALADIYPRKERLESARKIFLKLRPSYDLFCQMCDKIEEYKQTRKWQEGYVPCLNTWLAEKGWNDVPFEPVKTNKRKLPIIMGKNCKCGLPAVYKDNSGSYDHYYCPKHMPEKVKELYE
jgi:hypothetical protein